nr:uncharacterized protein CTRU02_04514 [Colletotrichum truncatum]KAF6795704.1 hypothetical protein CTRU02_04514 [Colletotrichum truncatum]
MPHRLNSPTTKIRSSSRERTYVSRLLVRERRLVRCGPLAASRKITLAAFRIRVLSQIEKRGKEMLCSVLLKPIPPSCGSGSTLYRRFSTSSAQGNRQWLREKHSILLQQALPGEEEALGASKPGFKEGVNHSGTPRPRMDSAALSRSQLRSRKIDKSLGKQGVRMPDQFSRSMESWRQASVCVFELYTNFPTPRNEKASHEYTMKRRV